MTVYALFWEMLKLVLRGSGRASVHLSVYRYPERLDGMQSGPMEYLAHDRGDRLCVLTAVQEGPVPS